MGRGTARKTSQGKGAGHQEQVKEQEADAQAAARLVRSHWPGPHQTPTRPQALQLVHSEIREKAGQEMNQRQKS